VITNDNKYKINYDIILKFELTLTQHQNRFVKRKLPHLQSRIQVHLYKERILTTSNFQNDHIDVLL